MNQVKRNTVSEQSICGQTIHTFLLRPICPTTYLKSQVEMDFSPLVNLQGKQYSIVPKFNNDRNAATASFTNSLDKLLSESSQKITNFIQLKKQNNSYLQKDQILQPKPSHNYCYVCKEVYQDYLKVHLKQWKHIEHKVHKKNIETSKYTHEINSLMFNFEKTKKRSERKEDLKKREQQCFQNQPSKKRIIQTSTTYQPISIKISKESMESTNPGIDFSKNGNQY